MSIELFPDGSGERHYPWAAKGTAMGSLYEYAKYALEVGERKDVVEHACRVASLAKAFFGDCMPIKQVHIACLLHDVVDRAINKESSKYKPEHADAIEKILLDFFTSKEISLDEIDYIGSILPDMVYIERESGKHRKNMAERASGEGEYKYNANRDNVSSEVVEMITDNYQGDIPKEVWKTTEPFINFEHLKEVLEQSNIESVAIKAVELLDNMKNPSSERQSAWLQDVLEAESFYAPIVEALGFEGLSSALRSEAYLVRLKMQDETEAIEEARKIYDKVTNIGVRNVVRKIFKLDESELEIDHAVTVDQMTGEKPVHVGEFAGDTLDGCSIVGNYRLKEVGVLANKIVQYGGGLPMDVMGLMVITEDVDDSAERFVDFIKNRAKEENGITLECAKSKNKPIFIGGSEKYVSKIIEKLKENKVDEEEYEFRFETEEKAEERRGYHKYEVSKLTFFFECDGIKIPTEVQFVTKDERRRSRVGEIAHLIYKYLRQYFPSEKEIEKMPSEERDKIRESMRQVTKAGAGVIESMYCRKENIDPNDLDVNGKSVPGRKEFFRELAGPALKGLPRWYPGWYTKLYG